MRTIIILLIVSVCFTTSITAQNITGDNLIIGKGWVLTPSIIIPPFMMRESVRPGAKLDAVLVAGVGGGIALTYQNTNSLTGDTRDIFSWSPFTIIMSGNLSQDTTNEIDVMYATTISFFNGLIVTGPCYQLGNNVIELDNGSIRALSRWGWLLGFGVSFGNGN
jgi:hypothetical protein